MLIVVADTSPVRYLVQIDQIQLLPRLFEKILIPSVVSDELRHPSAPEVVRSWLSSRPEWLEVSVVNASDDPSLRGLDDGEKSAISLVCLFRPTLFSSMIAEVRQRLVTKD
jgi:predicted nucleic acid-binding protein